MASDGDRLLRKEAVMDRIGGGKPRLTEMRLAGIFPQPIKITDGGRAMAWLELEVERLDTGSYQTGAWGGVRVGKSIKLSKNATTLFQRRSYARSNWLSCLYQYR